MEEDLIIILRRGDVKEYYKLADSVDINYTTKSGSSFLHYALASSAFSEEIVMDLIRRGADINKLDCDKRSPLECCCEYNRLNIAKVLLEKGAIVNTIDKWGNNPLWRATFKRNVELVDLLMKYGADPYNVNKAGKTPLDFAKQVNNEKIIELLTK